MKTFFFLCLFLARTLAAHLCGGTACLDTSSELDALCCRKQVYTQRYFTGAVLSLQKPNGCKKTFFFCACLETCTPAAQSCGGTLCLDTSSRGPRKRIAFVGCGRLTCANKFAVCATSRGPSPESH